MRRTGKRLHSNSSNMARVFPHTAALLPFFAFFEVFREGSEQRNTERARVQLQSIYSSKPCGTEASK